MSIVTFDGQSLAADSRKTVTKIDPATGEKSYLHRTDEQVKIELVAGSVKFRGGYIEALGRCGGLKLSTAIVDTINKGLLDIETHWADPRVYSEFKRSASVLIVTDRNAFHFQVSPSTGLKVTELERKPFAMGCGTEVAMYLMSAFKLPAQQAAAAVTLTYDSCGGPIRVLERDRWTGRLQLADAQVADTADQRRVLVAEGLIKALSTMKSEAEQRMALEVAAELNVNPSEVLTNVLKAVAAPTPITAKKKPAAKKATVKSAKKKSA